MSARSSDGLLARLDLGLAPDRLGLAARVFEQLVADTAGLRSTPWYRRRKRRSRASTAPAAIPMATPIPIST